MNFISRIIKSINAMRERLKIERHEAMYGPHMTMTKTMNIQIVNVKRKECIDMNLCMKEEYQDINLIKIYENYVRT